MELPYHLKVSWEKYIEASKILKGECKTAAFDRQHVTTCSTRSKSQNVLQKVV